MVIHLNIFFKIDIQSVLYIRNMRTVSKKKCSMTKPTPSAPPLASLTS